MIGAKEIATLYEASPFGGHLPEDLSDFDAETEQRMIEEEIEKLRDLGLDADSCMEYARDTVLPAALLMELHLGSATTLASTWFSALRAGFLLGRGYVED